MNIWLCTQDVVGCDVTVENDKVFMHGFKLPKYRCRGKGAPERLFQKSRATVKKPAGVTKKKRTLCAGRGPTVPCQFGLHGAASQVRRERQPCLWCSDERLAAITKKMLSTHYSHLTEDQKKLAMEHLERLGRKDDVMKPWRCPGRKGEACVFALAASAAPAQGQAGKTCIFCNEKDLGEKCKTKAGKTEVANMLLRMGEDSRHKALNERVPSDFKAHIQKIMDGLTSARGARKRPSSAVSSADRSAEWSKVLGKRQRVDKDATEAEQKSYREKVLNDRARARWRFGIEKKRHPRGEAVDNDTGLAPPSHSKLAVDFDQWCRTNSWAVCGKCSSMIQRELTEKALTQVFPVEASEKFCPRCRAKVQYHAPKPEHVPEPLRGLSQAAADALSPLKIDVGPEIRAEHNSGYRQHATIIRFFWHELSSKKRIKKLEDQDDKAKAKEAYKFLMERETSSYKRFQEMHHKFLDKHPDADERKRRRRLQFVEMPGLETALWPVLFYDDELCLTNVRATDTRRLARKEESDSSDDEGDASRHSTKRAYGALALASRIGYGCSYELLHFAYDLNLWSALGAKKSTSRQYDIPMRVLMKGHSFSPLYWLSVHWALLDMVRQIGYPKIFWTLSPYEWSMPYHEWVRDEMTKALRSRLHLPVAETLHVTHVLYQTVKGLLIGSTGRKREDPWQRHLLQAVDEEGCKCDVHAFMRLEFQDGTRKAATQDYHGSGRPHLHVLIFCTREALQNMNLDETLSATMPEKIDDADILPGIVEGSQLDRKGRSGWPIHEGCSGWDEEQGALMLAHSAEDHAKGLRPYFMDVMETLRCHQDLQVANDDGALRAYVTKYVSKFSDSNQQEWLNDSAEGNAIAATVLCRYKPLEPEMILQMFGASMRQWFVTTLSRGKRDFVAPWPRKVTPLEVELYEKAEWAKGKISLLDFLRKTNKDGKVSAWMKKKQEEQGKWYVTLEDFAADYKMQGEKIVAAETLSRLNDKFFGQWLMLNLNSA